MLTFERAPSPDWSEHRLWPLPREPWVMFQRWHDLLFAHWPVPVEVLRPHVPAVLPIDTFDGSAWVGIVPFRMTDVRARVTPSIPRLSAFPELNVRTYTSVDGKPGVYFFSLDAANVLAVAAARLGYRLPYYLARMAVAERDGWIQYASRRAGAGHAGQYFSRYRPIGEVFQSRPGSIEHWLTERYCLYTVDRRDRVRRADILHSQWPLQRAEAQITRDTMLEPLGLALPDQAPLLHFSRRLDVRIWWPHFVSPRPAAAVRGGDSGAR